MILDLTIENLLKSGCNTDEANQLYNTSETYIFQNNNGNFYVSKPDNIFYTDIDFYRMTCFNNGSLRFPYNFPDLVNEYFDLALVEFLEKQRTILGILFDRNEQFNNFISNEIKTTQQRIDSQKEYLLKMKLHKNESKENDIQICEGYINYLKKKNSTPIQQLEAVIPDAIYKTQNLFKVGLLFARGKMNKYFTVTSLDKTIMKAGYSAPSIAIELKNSAYNKWILATINNYTNDSTNGNKNVFNSLDMMTKIVEHCNAKNIDIDLYFMKRYLLVKPNA